MFGGYSGNGFARAAWAAIHPRSFSSGHGHGEYMDERAFMAGSIVSAIQGAGNSRAPPCNSLGVKNIFLSLAS